MDTDTYGIPTKIKDDGLRDTLVMINFDTIYNVQKIEKDLRAFLYAYQKKQGNPFVKIYNRQADTPFGNPNINRQQYFFTNGQYKVELKENQILFNCVSDYPGWSEYFPFINACVTGIKENINKYKKISVRYISVFPELSIFSVLDGDIQLKFLPNLEGGVYEVRYSVNSKDGYTGTVVAKMYDRIREKENKLSMVDITLASNTLEDSQEDDNLQQCINYIEFCHFAQKDVFFRLLSKEFVDSRKVE